MRRIAVVIVVALALLVSDSALQVRAAGTIAESAAGAGAFASASALLGVNLSGSTFGSGISLNSDGTVDGNLEEVLTGADAVTGLPSTIIVDALITGGTQNADGSLTVSGTASVTTASQTLAGVPITAVISTGGITLTVGTTTLSPQTVTAGAIFIGQQ